MLFKVETTAKSLGDIEKLLAGEQAELHENLRELDGWADRVMKSIWN